MALNNITQEDKRILRKVKRKAKDLNINFKNITFSNRKNKLYKITFNNDKKDIHFGSDNRSHFLYHGNKERRERFLSRWKNNKFKDDPSSALFYSYKLLW